MPLIYIGIGILITVVAVYIYRQNNSVFLIQQSLIEQEKMVETLQTDLAGRDASIATMQQDMAKVDSLMLKLREDIAKYEGDKAHIERQIGEKDAIIADLQSQIENREKDSLQSKTLFSIIADVAYDQVIVLDGDTTIIAINKSASDFFGNHSPIGECLEDVVSAPDLISMVQHAIHDEEGFEEQFKIGTRHYRARTHVIRYSDDDKFIGVAMQDITQLVRLNRARRDMVANISHELNTPIANIRLIIDGLFHEQSRPKRKASIASLRAIARETETLQWTVQELLDLSMIESGQAIMKLVDEPLSEIVDEAIARLDEKLDQKNINVVRHIPQKMRVLCDHEHLRRVFINLISNAIKWSPEDDAVTVSATADGEEVSVAIFDNGPGVPEDQRERIFERFYQVDTARSGTEGSGLGLAICKHIVEAHGGLIWAEGNAQGGGGLFRFTLLNATVTIEDDIVMDRAQHDYVLPNLSSPESFRSDEPSNGQDDDKNQHDEDVSTAEEIDVED